MHAYRLFNECNALAVSVALYQIVYFMPKKQIPQWGICFFAMPVGFEPQVRVRGARGAPPVTQGVLLEIGDGHVLLPDGIHYDQGGRILFLTEIQTH